MNNIDIDDPNYVSDSGKENDIGSSSLNNYSILTQVKTYDSDWDSSMSTTDP